MSLNISLTAQQRDRLLEEAATRETTVSELLRQTLEERWLQIDSAAGGKA